jgi:hypothetical protein
MATLIEMAGYLVSVLAAGVIVAGIEALNGRCPYARLPATVPVPVRPVVLRRTRS